MMFLMPGAGEMPEFFECEGDQRRYDDVFMTRIQSTDFSGQRRGSHSLRDYDVAREELRAIMWGHFGSLGGVLGDRPASILFAPIPKEQPTKDWDYFIVCGV